MNTLRIPSREEVEHYLLHVLKFTRVRTLTPGRRLYAHLVPGAKERWIPIELTGSQRSVTNKVMTLAYHQVPNPVAMPRNFKIRKVNKKLIIYEVDLKPKPRRPVREPVRRESPEPGELTAYQKWMETPIEELHQRYISSEARKRNNARIELSKKIVRNAINKVTADERYIKTIVSKVLNKVIKKNAVARQAERELQAELEMLKRRERIPNRNIPKPRVPTRQEVSYTHRNRNYERLRKEGHSDKTARVLLEVFGPNTHLSAKTVNKVLNEAEALNDWEANALKYGPINYGSARAEEFEPIPIPLEKARYSEAKQIPVQLRRKHRPDYLLYK